jgi:peptidoglycan/xylan/chitin deacetylase (PgdA/CDA1 family)
MIPAEEQRREIREAHRVLCDELPSVLPVIAYPYGLYDRATIAAARGVGMQAAVTMEGRAPGARPDPFTIPRVGAGNLHAPESLTLRLHRVLRPALIVRNRGMHPRVPRPTSAQASRRTMSRADGMVVE